MNDLSRPGMSVVTDNAMSIYRPEIAADRNTGITPPRQAIKAPQPLDKPASMSVNADRDPGFRTAHPRSSIPTQPERAPAQRPVEDRPMRPSEPRPPVIERPQQNPQQDRPVKRNQDDIYNNAPIRQQEHVPNPVRRPTPEQPRYEQPRQDRPQYNRPVERPLPPPQPQRQEQPRQLPQRKMPSPQPGNQAPVRRPAGSQ
jgi:hypothetical protein